MKVSHTPATTSATFDESVLVSDSGLLPVMTLADTVGLHALSDHHLTVPTYRRFTPSLLGLNPMLMAFFKQAGMVRLFSAVTSKTSSEALMVSRNLS